MGLKLLTFDGKEESWVTFKRKAKAYFELNEKSKGVLTGAVARSDTGPFVAKNEYIYHTLVVESGA